MGLMQGISAPQLTPFKPDGSVDYDRYAALSARLAQAGIDGIFVCGTTGEFVKRCCRRPGPAPAALCG